MEGRGRKSVAALSVIAGGIGNRPPAPTELTAEEVEVWTKTVAGEAADVFGTVALQQMLVDYCRHVVAADRLSEVIRNAMEPDNKDTSLKNLDLLLKMRDRETRAASDKATKLRLTNQSRYTPRAAGSAAAKGAGQASKPWQMP